MADPREEAERLDEHAECFWYCGCFASMCLHVRPEPRDCPFRMLMEHDENSDEGPACRIQLAFHAARARARKEALEEADLKLASIEGEIARDKERHTKQEILGAHMLGASFRQWLRALAAEGAGEGKA